jgi:hypothetical protein
MQSNKLLEVGDFIDLFEYNAGTWTTPPQFYRWMAVSLIAACLEDRAFMRIFEHAPLYPNVWIFLIGPSGTGKDHAVGLALHLLAKEDPIWMLDGKITMPAMYTFMSQQQKAGNRDSAPVYLISSDVTEQLPVGPEAKDFTSRSLSLFGGRDRVLSDITRTNSTVTVLKPMLNWLGGCTEEWFPDAIDSKVFVSGFAGRAFFVVGQPIHENYNMLRPLRRHDSDEVGQFLRQRVQIYQSIAGEMVYTPAAERYVRMWFTDKGEQAASANLADVEKNVLNRLKASLHKLSMICAMSEFSQPNPMRIRERHVVRAAAMLEEVILGVKHVGDAAHVTANTQLLNRVIEIVRAAYPSAILYSTLLKKMMSRGIKKSNDLQEIIKSLDEAGMVELIKEKPTGPGRWPLYIKWKVRKVFLGGADENDNELSGDAGACAGGEGGVVSRSDAADSPDAEAGDEEGAGSTGPPAGAHSNGSAELPEEA